jgi:hypothetical protein
MSDNLLIEVINTFTTVTPEKKKEITKIQGLSYGAVFHQVVGEYKSSVPVEKGGRYICIISNGSKAKSLRRIFDRETGLTVKSFEKDGKLELLAVPFFQFNDHTEQISWWYELSKNQDRERVFDMSKMPLQINVTDFDNRNWKPGIQLIPVRFSVYRSKNGNMGFNYIAVSDKQSGGFDFQNLSHPGDPDVPY